MPTRKKTDQTPYKEPPLTDEEILEIRKRYNITPVRERLSEEKKPKRKRNFSNLIAKHRENIAKMKTCMYKDCNTKCKQNKRFCAKHQKQFITSVANGAKRPIFKS